MGESLTRGLRFFRQSLCLLLVLFVLLMAPLKAQREHIHIVGSSTVYPFISAVAEIFGSETDYKTPIVESTGTGGGIKVFCNGVDIDTPDIVTSSRLMSKEERDYCANNGIKDILEITIGYDGIVIAKARPQGPKNLTMKQLFLALARYILIEDTAIRNPYHLWSDIDKTLPQQTIRFLGPPSTSGTRQTFLQIVFESFLDAEEKYTLTPQLRDDHTYIETAEQETMTAKKLHLETDAIAIFTFGFLSKNRDQIIPIKINDIAPSFETITSGQYPLSRPLFLYVKLDHKKDVAGLSAFIEFLMKEEISGPKGYLKNYGFIPLPDHLRKQESKKISGELP